MKRRFVLTLHSHLPWVLHHGRWPHGSDWLCEAAIDSYLPLLAALKRLEKDNIDSPLTLGITPILAAQFANPTFRDELDRYFEQRLLGINDAPEALRASGDDNLLPVVAFWRDRLVGLRRLWHELEGDLIGAFRRHAQNGRIELISSAATHGFLPLLARDESIRLQLFVGRSEHTRLFGEPPRGCWLPECAYRPREHWQPLASAPVVEGERRGIEEHLRHTGFQWFYIDAHLAQAGELSDPYHPKEVPTVKSGLNSPYRVYHVGRPVRGRVVRTVVRDPVSTEQIWNRHGGYPGDGRYLEFHKLRDPGGLRLWAVTDPKADLADKVVYSPAAAANAIAEHVRNFTARLAQFDETAERADRAVVAPFDTELFGHWWFEGVDFLEQLFRSLDAAPALAPATTGNLISAVPSAGTLHLNDGSWGAEGDFSMWLNPETEWTWERLWPLENRFWSIVQSAMTRADALPILSQAARELLLAQGSDWQFIISTGVAGDYATERFNGHCDALDELLQVLENMPDDLSIARARAAELERIDGPFPELIGAIAAAADLVPAR